jgi:hypothetical protein
VYVGVVLEVVLQGLLLLPRELVQVGLVLIVDLPEVVVVMLLRVVVLFRCLAFPF